MQPLLELQRDSRSGHRASGSLQPLCRSIKGMNDDFVKSPSAALRFILRHCGVLKSTPHSSGFARLAYGAFYEVVRSLDFLRGQHE